MVHFWFLAAYCKLVLAFSIYTNGANVLSIEDRPNQFKCVDAIKSLSTAWMISIFAHLYIIGYIGNAKFRQNSEVNVARFRYVVTVFRSVEFKKCYD